MKRKVSKIEQVNMLMKHASRNGINVLRFYEQPHTKIVYADCGGGSYFTIFCFIEDAEYLFNFNF